MNSVGQLLFDIHIESVPITSKTPSILIQPLPGSSDLLIYDSEEKVEQRRKKIECKFPDSRFGVLNLRECAVVAGGMNNGNLFTSQVFSVFESGSVKELSQL